MNELSNPGCVEVAANTGMPNCPFAPDKFVGAILIDKNQVFEASDIATAAAFVAKLQALTILESGKLRAYPVFRFEEIADNSEDVTIATLGYGSKQIVKDGKYDFTFRLTKGGLCFQKKLRKFNGVEKKVLFVDDNGVVYGTLGSSGFTGFSLDFIYANPWKPADGSNAAIFNLRFALSKPKEMNDDVAYIQTGVDVEESVKGLIDLELYEVAVAEGQATIGIRTDCDKVSIYDLYADDLADTTLWKVTKDGVTVNVNTCTKNATTESWELAFTGEGDHVISLVAPASLAEVGVGGVPGNGFEAISVTVTMPVVVEGS